jgi:hypothetical protein
VKHFESTGIAGHRNRHLEEQVRPVEARRTFATVVAGQRAKKESETLSKGSVGILPSSLVAFRTNLERREMCLEITLLVHGLRR